MKRYSLSLTSPERTEHLGAVFAPFLKPGSVILLSGEIGSGKTLFCRTIIQTRLSEIGALEDVPSPTFTIIQTYDLGAYEVFHADLYRLTGPDEIVELGIDEAFSQAIVLVEWPDRLGDLAPENALKMNFELSSEPERELHLEWSDPKWDTIVKQAVEQFAKT